MAQIRLVIDGQVQLSRNLRVFSNSMSDMSDFYRDAVGVVEKRTDEVFGGKGKNVEKGAKWKRLAESTEKARSRRWGYYKNEPVADASTLVWTGNLRDNRTRKSGKNYGKLTFNAPYAIYHHRGGGNLPKRSIIDLSRKTNQEIVRALQKKIHKEIGIFGSQA